MKMNFKFTVNDQYIEDSKQELVQDILKYINFNQFLETFAKYIEFKINEYPGIKTTDIDISSTPAEKNHFTKLLLIAVHNLELTTKDREAISKTSKLNYYKYQELIDITINRILKDFKDNIKTPDDMKNVFPDVYTS